MSLTEELLADLEGDDGGDAWAAAQDKANIADFLDSDDDGNGDEAMDVDVQVGSVKSVAKLRDSADMTRVIAEIDKRIADETTSQGNSSLGTKSQIDGPIESHPEYILIVEANNLAVEIDNDIAICHKFAKEKYSKRFPELESLVPTPLEYLMTAKELGNDIVMGAKNNERLQEFLTQATIMVVSVTSSTSQGTELKAEELAAVVEACDMAIELNEYRLKIFAFVESRMTFIAPNISHIVGANVAAKLMGLAGGLTSLSKV